VKWCKIVSINCRTSVCLSGGDRHPDSQLFLGCSASRPPLVFTSSPTYVHRGLIVHSWEILVIYRRYALPIANSSDASMMYFAVSTPIDVVQGPPISENLQNSLGFALSYLLERCSSSRARAMSQIKVRFADFPANRNERN
jgi:hypothetical protein